MTGGFGPAAGAGGRERAVDDLRAALALLMGADRRLKGRLARAGVPLAHSHLRALFLLLHQGEATAGALARATHLNPASVTAMVAQLEGRGLIERRRHAADRRVCLLALTEPGRVLVAEREQAWVGGLHDAFADMPAADLEAASRVIGRLTALMEQAVPDAGRGCEG